MTTSSATTTTNAFAVANEHKVNERYRAMMRAEARARTRESIEEGAKTHDAEVDERERRIAALDEEMDASERAHRNEAEAHARRLDATAERSARERRTIDDDVKARLRAMREVHEKEDFIAHERWETDVAEANDRDVEESRAYERASERRRASFEDKREEIRNGHGEDVCTMKLLYENKIRDLESELARACAPSVRMRDVDPERRRSVADADAFALDDERAYEIIRARDDEDARRLAQTLAKFATLKSKVAHWRAKTERRKEEWLAKRTESARDRADVARSYRHARNAMDTLTRTRARALRMISVASERAIGEISQTLASAKRVLDVDASARALELDARGRDSTVDSSNALCSSETHENALNDVNDFDGDSDAEYADVVLARYYATKSLRERARRASECDSRALERECIDECIDRCRCVV